MATKENKLKKGFFSTFYRSSTKSHKPKPEPAAVVNNRPVSQNSLLKELENFQTIKQAGPRRTEKDGEGKVVEGRKSVSHVETNLSSVIAFLQVNVLVSDMPGFMQVHAFRCARRTYDSLEKFSSKHMAYNMKKEFDKVYGPAWHCIVGSHFGSFVTHSTAQVDQSRHDYEQKHDNRPDLTPSGPYVAADRWSDGYGVMAGLICPYITGRAVRA